MVLIENEDLKWNLVKVRAELKIHNKREEKRRERTKQINEINIEDK